MVNWIASPLTCVNYQTSCEVLRALSRNNEAYSLIVPHVLLFSTMYRPKAIKLRYVRTLNHSKLPMRRDRTTSFIRCNPLHCNGLAMDVCCSDPNMERNSARISNICLSNREPSISTYLTDFSFRTTSAKSSSM